MNNPIVEESVRVYAAGREYGLLHLIYLALLAVFTILAWPSQSLMNFFRTGTMPAVFEVVTILELLAVSGISLFAGQDRLASNRIIRHSEWLEHTGVPIRTLLWGKLISAALHSLMLVVLATPFVLIASGPAGIPLRAALSTQWIVLLVSILCRLAGLLLSHIGEERYVVRVVGGWLFLALLFLVTIGVAQSLNPIIALVRQANEGSILVSTLTAVPLGLHPALVPTIGFTAISLALAVLYAFTLKRHRDSATHRVSPEPAGE
jgi:hypothetical protein